MDERVCHARSLWKKMPARDTNLKRKSALKTGAGDGNRTRVAGVVA